MNIEIASETLAELKPEQGKLPDVQRPQGYLSVTGINRKMRRAQAKAQKKAKS